MTQTLIDKIKKDMKEATAHIPIRENLPLKIKLGLLASIETLEVKAAIKAVISEMLEDANKDYDNCENSSSLRSDAVACMKRIKAFAAKNGIEL